MVRVTAQIAAVTAVVGILAACGLNEKKFEKKIIKAQCELYEECLATDFAAEFDSQKACIDAVASQQAADLELYDDCEFVKDEAKDCLKAIESLPCAAGEADYVDFNNSCLNVWVCSTTVLPTGTAGDDDDSTSDSAL